MCRTHLSSQQHIDFCDRLNALLTRVFANTRCLRYPGSPEGEVPRIITVLSRLVEVRAPSPSHSPFAFCAHRVLFNSTFFLIARAGTATQRHFKACSRALSDYLFIVHVRHAVGTAHQRALSCSVSTSLRACSCVARDWRQGPLGHGNPCGRPNRWAGD